MKERAAQVVNVRYSPLGDSFGDPLLILTPCSPCIGRMPAGQPRPQGDEGEARRSADDRVKTGEKKTFTG